MAVYHIALKKMFGLKLQLFFIFHQTLGQLRQVSHPDAKNQPIIGSITIGLIPRPCFMHANLISYLLCMTMTEEVRNSKLNESLSFLVNLRMPFVISDNASAEERIMQVFH
ncbi:hypothetical protein AB4K20DRAFT_1864339 [Rhizopus microsporus]|uniref:Uncharacterized protein n=1 Tax=Rhizopus microsporus TaxID=58291 RepID=A0A1X0RSZ8_RHIZD|nr:hypothetical protein BCV71DRAFT_237859 [Rhizopus microsporus]